MELDQLIKRMSPASRQLFERAVATASSRTHFSVDIAHWLDQALSSEDGLRETLSRLGVDTARAEGEIQAALEQQRTGNAGFPRISRDVLRLLFEAWVLVSSEFGRVSIEPVDLLLAVTENSVLRPALTDLSPSVAALDPETVRGQCADRMAGMPADGGDSTRQSNLQQFTVDLTEAARQGRIDRVIGRDDEIRQMIDILCRRRQNNPILTGEAGVGKTAVVEGLARRIVDGDVPGALRDVALHTLDMGLLQAGAGVKGEFENRLKGVIKDVQNAPHAVILFIDEAHTLIGAGNQAGSGDAANLLKPALARGELRTIAATTWAEYKKYFESDAALTRRFQVVKVDEPDENAAIAMLRNMAEALEDHHDVVILEEAVDAAVRLSHRYIAGRQLPDKCVSLLDTACARVRLSQDSRPAPLERCQRRLEDIDSELQRLMREAAAGHHQTERMATLRRTRDQLADEYAELDERWARAHVLVTEACEVRERLHGSAAANAGSTTSQSRERLGAIRRELGELQGEDPLVCECVDAQLVAEVVADWTGIPVGRMQSDEVQRVLGIETAVGQRVVGQAAAVERIARTMRTARAGLADPGRPLGVFLLVGPSGVGKTETALALAEQLYGSDRAITTINMSEFKEEHKVSLLMGSPPGYVGYGEGGILTEAVRRKPYSVVLLDEMEKAHPGVQEVFYQVFDKGTLRDGEGRDIDFRNTVIVMTSNAASDQIEGLCMDPDTTPQPDGLLEAIGPTLRQTFKPAFLGRVTRIPYFPLDADALERIVALQLSAVQARFEAQYHAPLVITDALTVGIVGRCSQSDTGARQIAGLLNNELLPRLSTAVLEHVAEDRDVGTTTLTMGEDGTIEVDMEQIAVESVPEQSMDRAPAAATETAETSMVDAN